MKNKLYYKARLVYRNLKRLKIKRIYDNAHKIQHFDLSMILSDSDSYVLFITNDNGGGTKQYSDQFIKKTKDVIVLTRISYGERPDVIYRVTNVNSNRTVLLYYEELDKIWNFHFKKIIVNTLVHFTNYKYFLKMSVEYTFSHPETKLIYFVHDFHSVCPRCNLVTREHYCNLNCNFEKCSLYIADRKINIKEWRKEWIYFLDNCSEIRTFSESSKKILLCVYPSLKIKNITVVPHDISYIKFKPIPDVDKLPIHFGIIGACISAPKGKTVILKILKKYGSKVPISLIGSKFSDYRIKRKKVSYTGKYLQKDLQLVIEKEEVSCAIFPSLWPETFSYVVSELMAMNLPIICFNYGAQAEKCKDYPKGIVIKGKEELWSVIDQMEEAGTWAEYVKKHPDYHTAHPL